MILNYTNALALKSLILKLRMTSLSDYELHLITCNVDKPDEIQVSSHISSCIYDIPINDPEMKS